MIKVDNESVQFEGTVIEVDEETAKMLRAFKTILSRELGEECGNSLFQDVIKTSQMSEEEIRQEIKTMIKELIVIAIINKKGE